MDDLLHAAVAAFWPAPTGDPALEPWATLRAGLGRYQQHPTSSIVVLGDPGVRAQGKLIKDAGLAGVLGYVSTRGGDVAGPVLDWSVVKGAIDAWLADPATAPDGIYFDEAVPATDLTGAQPLVQQFRATPEYADLTLMILASGCPDRWVVDGFTTGGVQVAPPDWVLLWEDDLYAYREGYSALAPPAGGTDPNDVYAVTMPSWWKDPAYRSQIVHTVHDTAQDYDWQDVTGRAVERNVGHLFVMDWRGVDHHGKHTAYDHLPPYWTAQSGWADAYDDHAVGLTDAQLVYAARRIGVASGALHAWPNFEQAWYGGHQVRGTFFLADTADTRAWVQVVQIPGADLSGPDGATPAPYDVSSVWGAVHRWATAHGHLTAMPTFAPTAAGQFEAVVFTAGVPWLQLASVGLTPAPQKVDVRVTAPVAVPPQQVEGRYTFAEAGAVVRLVGRVAHQSASGAVTGWPTFNADLRDVQKGGDPTGRTKVGGQSGYEAIVALGAAPISWADVAGADYGAQIP